MFAGIPIRWAIFAWAKAVSAVLDAALVVALLDLPRLGDLVWVVFAMNPLVFVTGLVRFSLVPTVTGVTLGHRAESSDFPHRF